MSSVYIHFPYCLYKCVYCDFNSYATPQGEIPYADYTQALLNELTLRHDAEPFLNPAEPVTTVFLGGGTPSLWPASEVGRLLEGLEKSLPFSPEVEITLEANPKTVTLTKLKEFKQAGITRLSLGVQSLHDAYLGRFGRIHSAEDAKEALAALRKAGFASWNADLIFGFPGQTEAEWKKDLKEILTWDPPHLSCYAFTVEKDAPYGKLVAAGKAPEPSDELQALLFEFTRSSLMEQGYDAYELSNFCKPGFESRHNLNYWRYGPFLGLGAGAFSFFHRRQGSSFGVRSTNEKAPKSFLKAVEEGRPLLAFENIPFSTAMGEFMMMGLRLKSGVDAKAFQGFFGKSLQEAYAPVLPRLVDEGLLEASGTQLTEKGFLFANKVMRDFLGP